MDRLVRGILLKIQTEKLVDKEYIEIYQFGLECILLKLVHIVSYLFIGICMGEVFSLLVSGSILIPLRRKAGGYHAKTRMGCYIFSCFVVFLLCLFNKVTIAPIAGIIGMVVADILVLMFAPVENENRVLEPDEKILFRKQAIGLLVLANVVILAILFIHKYLFVVYWLEKGVMFTGLLLIFGIKRQKVKQEENIMQKYTMNTKKIMMKTLAFMLAVLMLFGNTCVSANAEDVNGEDSTIDIRLLTYEEYIEQKQIEAQNSDVLIAMQSEAEENVMKPITELSEGKDIIVCENVNELTPLTNIHLTGMAARTIPIVSLNPVTLNPNSLKNGQITTETQIAWLWNFSDADGDNVLKRYLGGFPGAYYLGDLNNELGFVTQFDNPGHYTVLYQVMDSAGEFSEVVGYEFDVVPVENYQVIEGSFSAENEIQTYDINVDFADMDTAAFCLVRTGKSNVSMTITDSEGTELAVIGTLSTNSRRWYFVDKPSFDTTIETYTISVKVTSFDASESDFRLMVGSKKDVEPMISGLENAVWLDLYSEEKSNQFFTYYTPNRDESWYRFTADGSMVFTLLTYYPQIRFQIRDVDNLYVLFDSNDESNADVHKSKYCTSSYGYAEKARLTTTIGQDYYLVVYSPSVISAQDIIEKTMNITVGKPNMLSSSVTVYASSALTATSSGYSSAANIYVGDNGNTIPITAVADSVYIRSSTSGIRLSMIPHWRVRYPSSSAWNNSGYFYPSIDIGYVKDSDTNKNINGIWQISVQVASTDSPLTFVPGLYISYYYEIGD